MITLCRSSHRDVSIGAFAHCIVETGAPKERGDVIAGPPSLRTGRSVTGQGCVHKLRIDPQQSLGVKSETHLALNQEIAQEHIGRRDQPTDQLCTSVGGQVDRHRLLSPIGHVELIVVRPQLIGQFCGPLHVAHRITRQRLHLDDHGTHVGEESSARGSSHPAADFNHRDVI